jgi:TRAP-type transport system small permease protein
VRGLTRLQDALDRIALLFSDAAGILLALMIILINAEVFARYVLNRSTLVADEYSSYLFVWATLLGFGYALRSGQFLRVELLVDRLGERPRAYANLTAAIAGFGVSLILGWTTFNLALVSWRFGSRSIQASDTPLWVVEAVLPVALLWLALLYADIVVRQVVGLWKSAR